MRVCYAYYIVMNKCVHMIMIQFTIVLHELQPTTGIEQVFHDL